MELDLLKIPYFDWCALIVLLIIVFSLKLRDMNYDRANKAFMHSVIVVLVTDIFSIACVYLDNAGAGNVLLKYIAHSGYLIFHGATPAVYLVYLVMLTDTVFKVARRLYVKLLLLLPLIAILAGLAANPFINCMFGFYGEHDYYTHNYLFNIVYVGAFIYLVAGLYYIFKNARLFTRKWIFTLFAPYPLIVAATAVEYFNPNFNIEMIFNAAGLLFVYSNIQKPDEYTDPDTSLFNRTCYDVNCRKAFLNEKPVVEIIVSITNAKAIFDLTGKNYFSELIRGIADMIRQQVSSKHAKANLYRVSTSQFSIRLEAASFSKADELAEAINQEMNAITRVRGMNMDLHSCVCILECPGTISDQEMLDKFIFSIDENLSNQQVIRVDELFNEKNYRLVLDMDRVIGNAINNDLFKVFYQPIYSFEEGTFTSAEALIRLFDEKYGFISPQTLIETAEKNGTIGIIGDIVLDKVCSFMASPEFENLGIRRIDVNLSVSQCMAQNLIEKIDRIVDGYGIDHSRVVFEVTETAISKSDGALIINLNELSRNGYFISLDDFGSGYSNLQRIIQVPFNIIKLDKSFADNVKLDRTKIILDNIMQAIGHLNDETIAEGIEDEEQLEIFRGLGCDSIQGYYFSRALSQEDFVAFIDSNRKLGNI